VLVATDLLAWRQVRSLPANGPVALGERTDADRPVPWTWGLDAAGSPQASGAGCEEVDGG
jgi:hypothetical protein